MPAEDFQADCQFAISICRKAPPVAIIVQVKQTRIIIANRTSARTMSAAWHVLDEKPDLIGNLYHYHFELYRSLDVGVATIALYGKAEV